MREIKFRAFDNIDKKMYQYAVMGFNGELHVHKNKEHNGEWINIGCGREDGEVDYDNILMQYTGLLDKNGKEIYEGDIIEIQAWHIDKHEGYKKIDLFYRASVLWGIAGWWVSDNDTLFNNSQELFEGENVLDILEAAWDGGNYGECEKGISNFLVVGNIYENPDLIN